MTKLLDNIRLRDKNIQTKTIYEIRHTTDKEQLPPSFPTFLDMQGHLEMDCTQRYQSSNTNEHGTLSVLGHLEATVLQYVQKLPVLQLEINLKTITQTL